MQKFKNQVEFIFCVDDIQQPVEEKVWKMEVQERNAQATQRELNSPSLLDHLSDHTYLTILGWLSSLSREISRMAVLGTPSVSLGEVGKAEMGIWLQIFLILSLVIPFPQEDTNPIFPWKVKEEGCCKEVILG